MRGDITRRRFVVVAPDGRCSEAVPVEVAWRIARHATRTTGQHYDVRPTARRLGNFPKPT